MRVLVVDNEKKTRTITKGVWRWAAHSNRVDIREMTCRKLKTTAQKPK
jgi:hypothetical protein